jgi:hypothetical protein
MQDQILIEARKKAENAVSDMADPALKLKAFEVILGKLLNGTEPSSRISEPQKRKKRRSQDSQSVAAKHDGNSKRGRVLKLRDDGFFSDQRTIGELRDELRTRGWIYELTSLSGPLQQLVQQGQLRRALVTEGTKKIYKYVNP